MKLTVCVGSCCHLQGSHAVVAALRRLIEENGLAGRVELVGRFCLGRCGDGVNVEIDGEAAALRPEDAPEFFRTRVLPALAAEAARGEDINEQNV